MVVQEENEGMVLDQRLNSMIAAYLVKVGELKVGYPSERNLTEYEEILGIRRGSMKGKAILDVGLSNKLMTDAKAEGLNVTALEGDRQHVENSPFSDEVVHGLAQEMPFPSNSFDLVIASASVPLHIKTGDDFGALLAIYQLIRVCRPGGKVIISPLPHENTMRREKKINFSETKARVNKEWNIDLLGLFDSSGLQYRSQLGEKHHALVYHIEKPLSFDLKPIQQELIRLGEQSGFE